MRITYQIDIEDRFVNCYEDETLLASMRRNMVDEIANSCFGGGCGRCLIEVLEGTYKICREMNKEYVKDKTDKRLLACCITPCSDMKIAIIRNVNRRKNGN